MDDRAWIDLADPDPEDLVEAIPVDVYESALDRLQAPARHGDEPRPRMEAHGDYLFGVLVVPVFLRHQGRVLFQEIDLVATRQRLVTVRKKPVDGDPFELESVRKSAVAGGCSPGMCLYALVDEVAERYLTLVDDFDDDVDELEDKIEEWPAVRLRERISQLRHEILHVRRVLTPTRDLARSVLDNRIELDGDDELFPRDVEVHFADAYDKLLRATDGLDLCRDLLAGVRDHHQAQVANDQNEVMKRLTVVASILLVPTFIVGVYGQNFERIPELGLPWGYGWSWGLIILATVAQIVYFRRKKWM